MQRIPAELAAFMDTANDDGPLLDEAPDAFSKFLDTAALAGSIGRNGHQHAHNFAIETQELDERASAIYKARAKAALQKTAATEWEENLDAGGELHKRHSGEGAGYREYFRSHIALGKTAAEVLDGWLSEFPHPNPDVEKLMREVAAEF
jgi:hypothetical protein